MTDCNISIPGDQENAVQEIATQTQQQPTTEEPKEDQELGDILEEALKISGISVSIIHMFVVLVILFYVETRLLKNVTSPPQKR